MKKKFFSIILIFLFFASIVGCSEKTEQDNVEVNDGSKGVFYEISHDDMTVFLLGSIHVGLPEFYPLHGEIEARYDKSDYLAVEININDINEMEMMRLLSEIGMYTDGSGIKDHIDSELYDELVKVLGEIGLPIEMVSMFKPWLISDMISVMLLEKDGYLAELGIDQYFINKAEEDEKEIISLETLEDQMNLYTLLSPESQEEMLHYTVFETEENKEIIDDLSEKWMNGNIDALAELRTLEDDETEDYLDFFYALSDEKDQAMAEKIDGYLQSGNSETFFVVVGALHLVGENSIIDLLQQKGYEVKAVFQ